MQEWVIVLESLAAPKTHPLQHIHELALGGQVLNPPPTRPVESLTARGTETRRVSRAPGLPINITTLAHDEAIEIMRHVRDVCPDWYYTLALWGQGWTLEMQAQARRKSKSTIHRQFDAGIAVVMSALITRYFRKGNHISRLGVNQ